ncbi:hypothetical protein NU688_07315 [Variovorax sp. ZS18.2.2]|uniref:hypothetical protein n=1 Tax=Variovorax sp. ZS18.2.2 TaxID=2971255 RepID=UPI0021519391|nr:hypothetical protein [Variovorax sp. ZS18.2.2]MCR6475959.1 hypothetical protein [Variovorax sp. ZS18.2.2]
MTNMYESNLSGALMYMWGYRDARHEVHIPPGLLLNAQNALDNLVGDLLGAVLPQVTAPQANASINAKSPHQRRWFIAELKLSRGGFHEEVFSASAKAHRVALSKHLHASKLSSRLSRVAHFAIWQESCAIAWAPYVNTIVRKPPNGPPPPRDELDYPVSAAGFDEFYSGLNNSDTTLWEQNKLFSQEGIGLPIEGMRQYLACILQCCFAPPITSSMAAQASDELLFGYVSAGGGARLTKCSLQSLLVACASFGKTVSPLPNGDLSALS